MVSMEEEADARDAKSHKMLKRWTMHKLRETWEIAMEKGCGYRFQKKTIYIACYEGILDSTNEKIRIIK